MKDKLIQKLLSWTAEKLSEYTNWAELPMLENRNNFIQEYADDGLYVYNQKHINFYKDDGTVLSIDKNYNPHDGEVYDSLYQRSLVSDQKIYKLIDHALLELNGESYGYLHFVNPTGRLGTPCFTHNNMDTDYVLAWIKNVEFFILSLQEKRFPFPSDALNMTKRVLDDETGVYYFCPNLGPNNFTFTRNCRDFIEDQIHRLLYHKQMFTVALKDYGQIEIDWKTVKQASLDHWWVHRNK